MNRANQQALSQTTNMILVNIRNAEISYFNNFFSSFGVIAGLLECIRVYAYFTFLANMYIKTAIHIRTYKTYINTYLY